MREDEARELAERIRPELGSLLGPDDAAALESELDALLARGARGEAVSPLLVRLLNSRPSVSIRASEWQNIPPRTVQLPPGRRSLPLPQRYVCPAGHEDFRFDAGKPVPPCPHDGLTLVLDDSGAV